MAANNNNNNNDDKRLETLLGHLGSSGAGAARCPVMGPRFGRFASPSTMDEDEEDARAITAVPTSANDSPIPANVQALPTPPVCPLPDGSFFPTFPQMLADSKRTKAGIFSYEIMGGRRLTVIQDPELYEVIFSPHEMGMTPGVGDAVQVEMAKLAHAWFGIPMGIAGYTNASLMSVRRRIAPGTVGDIADKVGDGVKRLFDSLGSNGVIDLVKVAHGTFWPVNQAMYGEMTISPFRTPGADDWFHKFDEHIPEITGGVPLANFDESFAAYKKIVAMFQDSIDAGNHNDEASCPVMKARLHVEDIPKKFSNEDMAKFMVSLFWAPQANTLPMTWWTLAEILRDPRIQRKVEKEVREGSFKNQPDANGHWSVEDDDMPYTRACMYEVFRLYIANLTHRKVARDIPLRANGKWYRVPKSDMLTVASYVRHWDPEVYPEPEKFLPERWLDAAGKIKKTKPGDYFPFAHGRYSCSGKFLAMLEIPILVGLFFREFDTSLADPVPPADWDTVVASVRPKGWPYDTNCRVKYVRRAATTKAKM